MNGEAERHDSSGTHGHSLHSLSHWEVEVGGTSMEEMRGAWLEVMMMMWKCHDDVYYYIC